MCGIIGTILSTRNAAEKIMLGLFAEQHRGQESCGMAVSDGKSLQLRKEMGLVKEVFPQAILDTLPGFAGVGHVRYPTRGKNCESNSQPHLIKLLSGPSFAVASNGDIVNYKSRRKLLEDDNVFFESDNDGELLAKFIAYYIVRRNNSPEIAIAELIRNVRGAFSTVFLTRDQLYAFRDPWGIRPVSFGRINGKGWVVASESCSLDILGAKSQREIEPGEIVIFESYNKCKTIRYTDFGEAVEPQSRRHCIFELIYFARPDSYEFGEYVWNVQKQIGSSLAKDDKEINPDLVISIPDSSNFMALGYADFKKIGFDIGLLRNHYVGRTFLKPEQRIRDEAVRQKFNPLKGYFKGKKIVVVDDSIVRGTTVRKIVRAIKKTGAKEIHLRIGSPPVKFPCYYGIDTPTREELVANQKNLEELREFIGANSLKYLSMENLKSCVKHPENFCQACFNGDYILEPEAGFSKCNK
ncbi:MAG: amidophosphoribosyltransferase [Candidatus Coatesbacteria bacterium]|nr:amidophosphoribosyltransferase [Candidatus Coatesbacteria bacterium]